MYYTRAAVASTEVTDDTFAIVDDGDGTKKIAFQAAGITTGNTRTLNMPDKDLDFDYGTYTPTITDGANVASSGATANSGHYIRVGTTVTVSISSLIINPTAGTTLTIFSVSLPIASNFAGNYDCGGAGAATTTATSVQAIRITSDAALDEAKATFYSVNTASHTPCLTFTYTII